MKKQTDRQTNKQTIVIVKPMRSTVLVLTAFTTLVLYAGKSQHLPRWCTRVLQYVLIRKKCVYFLQCSHAIIFLLHSQRGCVSASFSIVLWSR